MQLAKASTTKGCGEITVIAVQLRSRFAWLLLGRAAGRLYLWDAVHGSIIGVNRRWRGGVRVGRPRGPMFVNKSLFDDESCDLQSEPVRPPNLVDAGQSYGFDATNDGTDGKKSKMKDMLAEQRSGCFRRNRESELNALLERWPPRRRTPGGWSAP